LLVIVTIAVIITAEPNTCYARLDVPDDVPRQEVPTVFVIPRKLNLHRQDFRFNFLAGVANNKAYQLL
jgi:hypothetical protein